VIDSCSAPRAARPPPSCLTPACQKPSAEVEAALCGLRVPPVDGSLSPPHTACYPSHFHCLFQTTETRARGRERERDGWTVTGVCCRLRHRVSCSEGGSGVTERLSATRGLSVSAAEILCVCVYRSVCRQLASELTCYRANCKLLFTLSPSCRSGSSDVTVAPPPPSPLVRSAVFPSWSRGVSRNVGCPTPD